MTNAPTVSAPARTAAPAAPAVDEAQALPPSPTDEPIPIDNPLLDDKMDYGEPAAPARQVTNDIDMDDIFSILGNN